MNRSCIVKFLLNQLIFFDSDTNGGEQVEPYTPRKPEMGNFFNNRGGGRGLLGTPHGGGFRGHRGGGGMRGYSPIGGFRGRPPRGPRGGRGPRFQV